MVSYFHHLAAIGGSPDFLKLVSTGDGLFPCRWHEHVDSWTANTHGAQMTHDQLRKPKRGSGHSSCKRFVISPALNVNEPF